VIKTFLFANASLGRHGNVAYARYDWISTGNAKAASVFTRSALNAILFIRMITTIAKPLAPLVVVFALKYAQLHSNATSASKEAPNSFVTPKNVFIVFIIVGKAEAAFLFEAAVSVVVSSVAAAATTENAGALFVVFFLPTPTPKPPLELLCSLLSNEEEEIKEEEFLPVVLVTMIPKLFFFVLLNTDDKNVVVVVKEE
jgi:hypothetical protein